MAIHLPGEPKPGWKRLWGVVVVVVCGLGLVLALAAGGVALQVRSFLNATPSTEHEERIVVIPKGSGPMRVSRLLAEEGVVADADRFALFLRWKKAAPGLRAGQFRFYTDQRPDEVLETLLNASEVLYPVTFPEGLRIEEMAARAEAAGFGTAARYTELARDAAFIASLDLPVDPPPPTLEGLLVPDTYSFPRAAVAEDVVRTQAEAFKTYWNDERRERAATFGLTPYEVAVLASVVEKETGQAAERPHIASVFHNRLKKRMRLESDPTIIYGLKNYDGNIRRADIRRPHPWNTYVIRGLPPTPIAGPGIAALDAVLWPIETDDLFFVSKNDGTHHFSETYAEHARMVNQYQRRRKK